MRDRRVGRTRGRVHSRASSRVAYTTVVLSIVTRMRGRNCHEGGRV